MPFGATNWGLHNLQNLMAGILISRVLVTMIILSQVSIYLILPTICLASTGYLTMESSNIGSELIMKFFLQRF